MLTVAETTMSEDDYVEAMCEAASRFGMEGLVNTSALRGHYRALKASPELRSIASKTIAGIDNDESTHRPRIFVLQRDEDVSGISGTGLVAWVCVFPDGKAVTRWEGTSTGARQTCVWDSVEDILTVHGHGGRTRLVPVA